MQALRQAREYVRQVLRLVHRRDHDADLHAQLLEARHGLPRSERAQGRFDVTLEAVVLDHLELIEVINCSSS